MNEMKNFFNATDIDTISECLSGEKLLNASRDAKGNTLLTFESSYEGYSDLLTIMPDGSVIGTFICDEEQRPQTVNDNQRAALELPTINYTYTPGFDPDSDLDTDSISSMLPDYFGLLKPLHEEDGCDPSEGIVLLFQDEQHAKEPSMELVITPKVTTGGVPVLSVEVNDLPKK